MSDTERYNKLANETLVLLKEGAAAVKGANIGSFFTIFQLLMKHSGTIGEIAALSSVADPAERRENLSDFALELADVATLADPNAVFKPKAMVDPAKWERFADAAKDLADELI